jgi:UDPglucose--hexose-1-phosphate uridylyltransferase
VSAQPVGQALPPGVVPQRVPGTSLADGRVRRTAGELADGREIIYFDDGEPYLSGAPRHRPDTRELPPAEPGSTLRFDALTGEWVAIASHRNERTFFPPREECPLCPTGRGTQPSEIPALDYDVVVFENRFPSFSGRADPVTDLVDGEPLWPQRAGRGRCEVVCFTSDHELSFARLAPARARTVIEAWADRTAELSTIPGVEQVFCFENRGEEIGVTLHHPHGQIYAYPYVTPRTERVLVQAAAHRQRTGGNLLRDLLAAEQRAGTRVVLSGERWTAYVPAAPRWPLEVHLAPHRDVPDLAALDDAERDELAAVYLELLRRVDRFYDGVPAVPYVAGWHQAPTGMGRDLARLQLQLFSVLRAPGKLKYLAGSESGMAAWINDSHPDEVAARLREVAS